MSHKQTPSRCRIRVLQHRSLVASVPACRIPTWWPGGLSGPSGFDVGTPCLSPRETVSCSSCRTGAQSLGLIVTLVEDWEGHRCCFEDAWVVWENAG